MYRRLSFKGIKEQKGGQWGWGAGTEVSGDGQELLGPRGNSDFSLSAVRSDQRQ